MNCSGFACQLKPTKKPCNSCFIAFVVGYCVFTLSFQGFHETCSFSLIGCCDYLWFGFTDDNQSKALLWNWTWFIAFFSSICFRTTGQAMDLTQAQHWIYSLMTLMISRPNFLLLHTKQKCQKMQLRSGRNF